MKWLTLDYIKQHSRIDHDCEDDLLCVYAEAAEETLLNILNTTFEALVEKYGQMPMPLVEASLMLVDVGYQNRMMLSPQNMYLVPYTFDFMVKPYKIL